MAKKVVSKKTSSKVDVGIAGGISNTTSKKAQKTIKKMGAKAICVALLVLFVGICVGCGAWWIVCREDCFEMLGQEEITLSLTTENYGQYVDFGVKVVAFGRDESESVEISTNLSQNDDGTFTATEIGTYYIKYSSKCFKYGTLFKIEKVRLVTFVEPDESDEIVNNSEMVEANV